MRKSRLERHCGALVLTKEQVIEGQAEGRTDDRQITLFDSVGFAIEDFSALRYIAKAIKGTPFFTQLDMIADPDDPRDLFGMVARAKGD